jgi:hypothetical protein
MEPGISKPASLSIAPVAQGLPMHVNTSAWESAAWAGLEAQSVAWVGPVAQSDAGAGLEASVDEGAAGRNSEAGGT